MQAYSKLGHKMFWDFHYEVSVNTLGQMKKHSCNPHMNQNYDDEFYHMIALENEAMFKCSVPFHPKTISNVTGKVIEICKDPDTGKKWESTWEPAWGKDPLGMEEQIPELVKEYWAKLCPKYR